MKFINVKDYIFGQNSYLENLAAVLSNRRRETNFEIWLNFLFKRDKNKNMVASKFGKLCNFMRSK